MAETRKEAQAAFDAFLEDYRAKHPKAAECLQKDRDELLAFFDFPAEHWAHLRTTNPIESNRPRAAVRIARALDALHGHHVQVPHRLESSLEILGILSCDTLTKYASAQLLPPPALAFNLPSDSGNESALSRYR
jgi:hypothetical protein